MKKRLAIIPARGGSKGVPGKNIKALGGKPLIAWTIEAARSSGLFDSILVDTDDQKIADAAEQAGVAVPRLRPAELAKDNTPMLDVIRYVLDSNPGYDTIVLLQPTCPFRTADEITKGIEKFEQGRFDSLLSVTRVPDKYNPHWVFIEKENGLALITGEKQPISRRQDLPATFIREGSLYIFSEKTVRDYNNIYGEKIGYLECEGLRINIDTPSDFEAAEEFLKSSKSDFGS
jgi:CMP-N,N'-diacetyllegionaminic acid synthase